MANKCKVCGAPLTDDNWLKYPTDEPVALCVNCMAKLLSTALARVISEAALVAERLVQVYGQ